ncbi:MAG: hypothetical protein HN368_10620 [Spirochaetales bacterium]|nr:hypothetical protein [Spirochaetales bacterium]
MVVVVFTSKKALTSKLEPLAKSRVFDFSIKSPDQYKKTSSVSTGNLLFYLDSSDFSEKDILKAVRSCRNSGNKRIGIIDQATVYKDPARLFHEGAADYIGKLAIQTNLTSQRIRGAINYCDFPEEPPAINIKKEISRDWKLSGKSWKNIKSGQEYTFCFMFVEIDLLDEWRKKSGRAHLDEVKAQFQKHIQQVCARIDGKLWMWMDLGGLILFPFDGKSCNPILNGLELVVNRTIISAEEFNFHTVIKYRIALHIGNTVYKTRGNTGTIVSDTVNFLFHLGHQFAKAGNFYLTEPVCEFIPKGFEDCFVSAGSFEEMPISRMRLPVS